jgi:hypothetical protein
MAMSKGKIARPVVLADVSSFRRPAVGAESERSVMMVARVLGVDGKESSRIVGRLR